MLYSIDHQELATEMYKRELRAEGKLELAISMFKKKLIELKDVA